MTGLEARIEALRSRMDSACRKSGRKPSDVTLVAVTKNVAIQDMLEAVSLGLGQIGENRLQEADAKLLALPTGVVRHFIGRIQTNKLGKILDRFDWIQSVAEARVAEKCEQHLAERQKVREVLLQIDISGEATKAGMTPDEARALLDRSRDFSHLKIRGLMAIGPKPSDETQARAAFAGLKNFFEESSRGRKDFDTLSIGMSGDFEIAIEEGSTMVRIGTAIFGERGEDGKNGTI